MLTHIENAIKKPVNKYIKTICDEFESNKILGHAFVTIFVLFWAVLWFYAGLQY